MMRRIRLSVVVLVTLLGWGCAVKVAAQGTVAPVPRLTFETNTGTPCASCKLYTYAAGTTTPLDTYADPTLSTELPNPITLNSAGRPTTSGGTETNIYLQPQLYKFTLTTAGGTTIWTADNVSAVPTLTAVLDIQGIAGENLAAGNVVYLSAGDGSLTPGRWYQTDADQAYSSALASLVGMVPSAIDSGDTGAIRLQGRLTGLSGLSAGTLYYVSATAGGLTASAPANSRTVGMADTPTSMVIAPNQQQPAGNFTIGGNLTVGGNTTLGDTAADTITVAGMFTAASLRVADTNASHAVVITPGSNLTADRMLTLTTGDAARTVTLNGDPTLNDWFDQGVKTTSSPTFDAQTLDGDLIFSPSSNAATARLDTTDGFDSKSLHLASGGAFGRTRGAGISLFGNEYPGPVGPSAGSLDLFLGDVSGARLRVLASAGTTAVTVDGATGGLSAATSVATPSLITESGALTVTPAAGSNLNIALSTTGDFAVNTDDLVVDTSSGNVGVGTTAPNYPLHIHRPASTTTWFQMTNAGTGSSSTNGFFLGVTTGGHAAFWTGNQERVRIESGGNVGIGTSVPGQKLDVAGGVALGANTASANNLTFSGTAPTISSGFGTSPSVTAGTATSFRVNVGTGGTASSGVIGMPTAATGWNCMVTNITAKAANDADQGTFQTASSTTTVTVQNQTLSSGAAAAWTASDILALMCAAF